MNKRSCPSRHSLHLLTALILVLVLGGMPSIVLADNEAAKQVHWAMGSFFGTGWYTVDENRSVFIFRIPPRQTVRESSFDEYGKRKLGVEIQYLHDHSFRLKASSNLAQ